jgi:hypothetical protein
VRVAHGVAEIPVPAGSPMGGYADRRGGSTGTADRLEAHVVTVTDGVRSLALVVLDVVCVNVDLADAVRSVLPVDDVWVCATHTHSGPETGCVPGGSATPPPWVEVITAAVARAFREAVATSCWPTATSVAVSEVASVRSRPDGARPVPVDVVAFHGPGLRGLLVVLPVHPTVLPASSTVVSADLTGAVRRALAERLGVWVVVLTGAAGDISTRGVRRGADLEECARLGSVVADQVIAAVRVEPAAEGAEPAAGDVVRTASADLALAPAECPEGHPQDVELPQGIAGRPGVRRVETLRQAWRLRRAFDAPLPATVRAAQIGGIRLVGLPGEPFLDLRPPGVILVGYVGGYVGYLPTREAFAAEPAYETVISPVAPGESERLVTAAVGLFG